MKFKKHIYFLLYLFLFLNISNLLYSSNYHNVYKAENISRYFSAAISIYDNDYANSYKNLKKIEDIKLNHRNFHKNYQQTLVNLGKFREAYFFSKKIEEKGSDTFDSNLITGIFYLKNKNFKKSHKYFKKLQNKAKNDPLKILVSASLINWTSFHEINLNEALDLNNNIPQNFENVKKIQNTFTHCYYDSVDADQYFYKLHASEKVNFSRYSFFHVNYLHSIGNSKKGKIILEETLKNNPRNLILNQLKKDMELKNNKKFIDRFDCKNITNNVAEIFYVFANSLSSQSFYQLSNFYLSIAKYLNSDFTSYQILYAENFYNEDNLDKSKKIYESIAKKSETYKWYASKQISKIFLLKKEKNEAINLMKKAFNGIENPSIYEIYDYASFLRRNEKFEDCIKNYSIILKLINKKDPLYAKVTDGRGICYERIDNWENAEKDFLNSLSAEPDQAYVINYLAYSWIEKGIHVEKSLEMLEKANELKSNDGYIIDSLGWALYKLKKYDESEKFLRLAVQIMPSDPIVNDHYGDSLWMNKKNLQARYYWNYVLNLDDAEEKLKKIIKKKLIFGLQLE